MLRPQSDFQQLRGRLLKLDVKCQPPMNSFCVGGKLSGSSTHSISFYLPHHRLPSAMTYDPHNNTQESRAPSTPRPPVGPTPQSAEEQQLEKMMTGLCISVAVLMTLWLTCFLVEKKVQRKSSRTATISTQTSSSKTYTYEVSSVRKTLMEMFDMPMIKIHSTDDNGSKIRPPSNSSDKSKTNERDEGTKSEDDLTMGSNDVFTNHEPSGYSTSSSDDLKGGSSDKAALLEVPKHKPPTVHDDFAHWVPMYHKTNHSYDSHHDSPSKKDNSPKNSPKRIRFGGKKHLEHDSPSKPKSKNNRKKHAAVRVAMEDEVVYTRPGRNENSNNNYIEMQGNKNLAHSNNVRESPSLTQQCTKL